MPRLKVSRRRGTVVLHPTCSVDQLGLRRKLEALLGEIAEDVHVPVGSGCCGMAGDRGLLHPELPASALREVKSDLEGRELDACVSSNRTCEVAPSRETGRAYASFVFAVEESTRPGA